MIQKLKDEEERDIKKMTEDTIVRIIEEGPRKVSEAELAERLEERKEYEEYMETNRKKLSDIINDSLEVPDQEGKEKYLERAARGYRAMREAKSKKKKTDENRQQGKLTDRQLRIWEDQERVIQRRVMELGDEERQKIREGLEEKLRVLKAKVTENKVTSWREDSLEQGKVLEGGVSPLVPKSKEDVESRPPPEPSPSLDISPERDGAGGSKVTLSRGQEIEVTGPFHLRTDTDQEMVETENNTRSEEKSSQEQRSSNSAENELDVAMMESEESSKEESEEAGRPIPQKPDNGQGKGYM
jgi:hypothetical protein